MAPHPDAPPPRAGGSERWRTPNAAATLDAAEPSGPADPDDGRLTADELTAARAGRASAQARAESTKKSTVRNLVEWIAVIAGAVMIAVIVRMFVFQTFWIPSPSMASTLVEHDRVLVNKLSYKFHDVHRGDVVVFERPPTMPESKVKDLIKRVVGLPGDRVSILDGTVRIDGRVLDEPYTNGVPTEPKVGCGRGDTTGIDTAKGLVVPEGHVLVLGDNRTNSDDGRCFGPIDEDLIVGRAFLIMWPPSKMGGL